MTDEPSLSAPAGSLERLRARLTAPRGARRIDELLCHDDAAAAVAALAPGEVFELVQDAGFEDAGELMALVTPAQVQGCLDLASWDKDTYLPEAVRPWLSAVLETGFEKVGEIWAGLDPEARMLFLQRSVVVYDVTFGESPDEPTPGDRQDFHEEPAGDPLGQEEPPDEPLMTTPDGFFILKLLGGDEAQRLTMRLIEDLYRADGALARHTIQGARSEPAAELEEMSYRWRAGRMADQGYVDFYEALELFRPLEVEQVRLDESTAELDAITEAGAANLPAKVAQEVLSRAFLARALAELDSTDDAAKVEAAIVYLINRVLAAARARPGEHEVVQRAAHYGSAMLSLGLEAVARGDARRGAIALRQVAMPRLFRVGYTLTLRLAKAALALAQRGATAESPAREVVAALSSPRPLWSRSADQPPASGARPLESLADLRRATDLLRALSQRIALVERLGVDLLAMAKATEPVPTLEAHLRTALLRVAGGGAWSAAGLTDAELTALRRRAFAEGMLVAAGRERCHDAVIATLEARDEAGDGGASASAAPALSELPALIDGMLAQLEAALGPIQDDTIDTRFIDGLLVLAPGAALRDV